ncbi:hypothetical protein BFR80_006535 [Acinetobacter pittii]|uniref:hypothetical protein n=1 Tax=Acinetobacter pittii TaxID=48296 RepID=UPI000838C3A7|nr:hypothetical protein [Acinetobacter pittii]MCK0923738.1 hypothetical protein [Acinetobacter pittii]
MKIKIGLLILSAVITTSVSAADVKGAFNIFESASKLWQICVNQSIEKYSQNQVSAEEIASASLSSCSDKEDLVYESMVNFQSNLDKNKNKSEDEIREIVNNEIIEYRNNVKRNAIRKAIEISNKQEPPQKQKSTVFI